MASLKALLSAPFHQFIHKDFHEAVAKMTFTDASLFLVKSHAPCQAYYDLSLLPCYCFKHTLI
ncbi:hypothetical protein CFP56_027147 [Quercus suber]|uniref:Uncharacterized protein n=1 Tax=Quercus suber TaxID=58331 RepID=A0AAW0JYP3_QUESU